MGIRNRKGVLRNIAISILGYGGDVICSLRAVIRAVVDGGASLNPDRAKKEFEDMNK